MGDKLISANALQERIYHDAFETDSDMQKWDGGCWIRYKMFENALEDAPTVDAVPVVRCKECKDWTTWNDPTETQSNYCPLLDYWTKGEFYCAFGERKDNEETKTNQH